MSRPDPTSAPTPTPGVAATTRVIHAAMISGVVILGVLVQTILRKNATDFPPLPTILVSVIPILSVVLCAAALLLRQIVPRRPSDASADLFWSKALAPAMIVWAVVEAAALVGIVGYWLGGSKPALGAAVVALAVFVFLNPRGLEAR